MEAVVSNRMNWERAKARDAVRYRPADMDVELVPVETSRLFWLLWRSDKEDMKACGFRVVKVGQKWCAYVQRRAGHEVDVDFILRRRAWEAKERAIEHLKRQRR